MKLFLKLIVMKLFLNDLNACWADFIVIGIGAKVKGQS